MTIYMTVFGAALSLIACVPMMGGGGADGIIKNLLFMSIAWGRAAGQGASTLKWVVNSEVGTPVVARNREGIEDHRD